MPLILLLTKAQGTNEKDDQKAYGFLPTQDDFYRDHVVRDVMAAMNPEKKIVAAPSGKPKRCSL